MSGRFAVLITCDCLLLVYADQSKTFYGKQRASLTELIQTLGKTPQVQGHILAFTEEYVLQELFQSGETGDIDRFVHDLEGWQQAGVITVLPNDEGDRLVDVLSLDIRDEELRQAQQHSLALMTPHPHDYTRRMGRTKLEVLSVEQALSRVKDYLKAWEKRQTLRQRFRRWIQFIVFWMASSMVLKGSQREPDYPPTVAPASSQSLPPILHAPIAVPLSLDYSGSDAGPPDILTPHLESEPALSHPSSPLLGTAIVIPASELDDQPPVDANQVDTEISFLPNINLLTNANFLPDEGAVRLIQLKADRADFSWDESPPNVTSSNPATLNPRQHFFQPASPLLRPIASELIPHLSGHHLAEISNREPPRSLTPDPQPPLEVRTIDFSQPGTPHIGDIGGIHGVSSGTWMIQNFTGVGNSEQIRSPFLPNHVLKVNTLRLYGPEFTARNLILTPVNRDLVMTFEGAQLSITLRHFAMEDLDNLQVDQLANLPAEAPRPAIGMGNILFHGDQMIQDSFDVADADSNPDWDLRRVLRPNTVTFLNDESNFTVGFEADTVEAAASDDVINGQGGQDTLVGGRGNDVLRGGTGNDILLGGIGINQLVGGTGADIFVCDRNGTQYVRDFQIGVDRIAVRPGLSQDDLILSPGVDAGSTRIGLRTDPVSLMILSGVAPAQLTTDLFLWNYQPLFLGGGS